MNKAMNYRWITVHILIAGVLMLLRPQAASAQDAEQTEEQVQTEQVRALPDQNILEMSTNDSVKPPLVYVLEDIVVEGNDKTDTDVIKGFITLKKGEPFSPDDNRLIMARYHLLSTGFFSSVRLLLRKGSERGSVLLVVQVVERGTIVVQDIALGWSDITPYGGIDVAENNFLGSGIHVSAAVVGGRDQVGSRLRFSYPHFLDLPVGIRFSALYNHAKDYFGNEEISIAGNAETTDYATVSYERYGGSLGISHDLGEERFVYVDYRFEALDARLPTAASHRAGGVMQPIEFDIRPDVSFLSTFRLGFELDTRDDLYLTRKGHVAGISVELGSHILGSSYDFAKFNFGYDHYVPLPWSHTIKASLFLGLILGDAPFFAKYFIGDLSALVPSRVLEMNFAHLRPSMLNTSIQEKRYEDIAGSATFEYIIPLYRGYGFLYGFDFFFGAGLIGLASEQDLYTKPQGYSDFGAVPIDITADLGLRFNTNWGVFGISASNFIRLIPSVGAAAVED